MSTDPQPLILPAPEDCAAWLASRTEAALATARDLVAALKANPAQDALAALQTWNKVTMALQDADAPSGTLAQLHPLADVRAQGEQCAQEVDRLRTQISLDAELYQVFAGLDAAGLDEEATRLLAHTLRDFRRSGVGAEEPVRARIAELADEMMKVEQAFDANIRDDVRSIRVSPETLAGMPPDWLETHPAEADGLVTVTTDYPDAVPLGTYAHDADVRRELQVASLNRGYPANEPLLHQLLEMREEFARLVGYSSWADYDAEVKMITTGAAIADFIEQISDLAEPSARRDYDVLLERLRQDRPDAQAVDRADQSYYTERLRAERFGVDAQQVRRYFAFEKVLRGLLDVTGRLFGLEYRPVPDAVTWHADVQTYDVLLAVGADGAGRAGEPGAVIGRIHLDLHPREGKFKHAAQFDLVTGVDGMQIPEGVLGCNLGRGLLEHDEVVTLFHEFGHLIHHLVGGHTPWARFSGVATEWDFVEAPSQMLEEWAWDPEVLRTFATDGSDEPIPAELVRRMRTAEDFGKGFLARTQMFYAAVSYRFHMEDPADLTGRTAELQEQYSLFPYIPGTHFFASFGHLTGYSSGYYTYMWSLVIAKDMFSAFDAADLFAPEVAARYRDEVLAPGGSRDAADLVAAFLGRPYSFEAFGRWLAR